MRISRHSLALAVSGCVVDHDFTRFADLDLLLLEV